MADNFEAFMLGINLWHWFGLAVFLGILEISLGTSFFLLWLGLSATTVGVVLALFPNMHWQYQGLLFALQSIGCIIFWHMHLKHNLNETTDEPRLNRRSEQYIGRILTLHEPIINGLGKVKVDDSTWKVECDEDLPENTKVKVIGVDGVLLKVEKN